MKINLTINHPPRWLMCGAALLALLTCAAPAGAQSLRFDGVNDFVNVPNSGSLTLVGRVTVEAWVNRAAVGTQHSIVEKFGNAGTGQGGYDLRISAGDRVQFETRDDGGRAVTVTGATAIPANTWVHIAGTFDGANNRVFVNGVQDGIVGNGRAPRAGNTALKIGARGNDNGTPMNGGIDDVRIWNVARTAAQITTGRTNCLAGDEAGLVALWHMDEGTGNTTADATANHNNGTLLNAVAWDPLGAFSCGAAGPSFDALEIFTAPAPVLAVPPVNFGGTVVNDTRAVPTNLPAGTIVSIVFPGATVQAINTVGAGSEWVLDAGSEIVRVYTHAGTRIVNAPVVGSVVKVVASRTVAPGPIVADGITLRTVAVSGSCISFQFQGVVNLATPTKWTVGGVVFNILGAPVPTDIALDTPLVVGTTVVDVQFIPTPGAFVGPRPAIPFDALEIFPPAAAVLAVPAPLFRATVANTVVLPSPMPPGTIAIGVIPGGTVQAVNTDAVTGGQEWVIDTGVGIARVYTAADTVIRAPATGGSIVKVVADRTLAPGPLVAEVITARQVAVGGLDFSFAYQGVVTRADPDVWTIGAVDFNIVPVTGALPTDIALDAPLVVGTTVVTVQFLLAPGAALDPPTVNVTAIDAAAAETASDPAVFRITRANTTFIPLTVSFTLTGTAVNGTDYTLVPLTVSMPVGAASADVTITPIDDVVLDPNETVILTLAAGTNYIVGSTNTATAVIQDNEIGLTIVATKADAAETGPTNAIFTVTRTGSTASDLTVNYTIGGTASNGVDYLTLSGSVLIPALSSSATITVTPIDDALSEPTETVVLTLVKQPGFITAAGNATATILDNDAPPTFALQFNGVNQRVDMNGGGSLNLVGNLTVEAWINRAAVGVQHSVFEKFGNANTGIGGYDLRVSAGDRIQFEVRDDGGRAVTVTGATAIPANTWVHVAGHWDGANLRVFVNGVQDAILANGRPPRDGVATAHIGARGNDGGTPFNGQIDEVRVWNVARSAAQINASRNTCIPGATAGLVGYWRLDEGAGTVAVDASGRGNNGTLINGPVWVPSTSPVVCAP
jgi:hypothetical protein